MSAFDITGAFFWTILALIFWCGAFVPSKPPKPAYSSTEAACAFVAVAFTAPSVFCISRLFGATL